MYKYHGYLLACIIIIWVAIIGFFVRTWLLERKQLSQR